MCGSSSHSRLHCCLLAWDSTPAECRFTGRLTLRVWRLRCVLACDVDERGPCNRNWLPRKDLASAGPSSGAPTTRCGLWVASVSSEPLMMVKPRSWRRGRP
ncbi:hypothetical protein ZWY2020_038076 [Hordeum vulgare]|nr:hypothetical protein ZWY2020_038076 [Hordeum vulgare]